MKIIANLDKIRAQIQQFEQQYERKTGSVRLLAVSKTRPSEEIILAAEAGQLEFGENYCQEAIEKIQVINKPDLIWHFIGPIQSNKTKLIAEHFDWVHTVDRIKIAKRLNQYRPENKPPLNICIQINISQESSKSGIHINDLDAFIDEIGEFERLSVRGLMALPAPANNLLEQRRPFAELRTRFEALNGKVPELDTLSIGTSQDVEAAIAEGATIVRIGTAIFGPRHA